MQRILLLISDIFSNVGDFGCFGVEGNEVAWKKSKDDVYWEDNSRKNIHGNSRKKSIREFFCE